MTITHIIATAAPIAERTISRAQRAELRWLRQLYHQTFDLVIDALRAGSQLTGDDAAEVYKAALRTILGLMA